MLILPSNAKIFVYQGRVDLRCGAESLSSLIEKHYSESITSGAFFVFVNRVRNCIKVLYWDGDGVVIWNKRLAQGRYPKKHLDEAVINRRKFFMLLEGIIPKRFQKRYQSN